ncbi:MAG: hypothetical protein L6R39_007438 [Caloplaca ligustica]|nr:MAG: hypothetical protein L6R39_007438 [Caloplaca ligustica]
MVHVLEFPEDLIILIVQNLQMRGLGHSESSPSRKDLTQLCLASRLFLPTTQRMLYSCFWCDKQEETWRIRAFLRTVIANPSLASCVVRLCLSYWCAWDIDSDEWNDGYDEHRKYLAAQDRCDRKWFRNAIRDPALPEKTFWQDTVRKDVDEVYLALLILLLPNLQELYLGAPLKSVILAKALDHATLLRPIHAPYVGLQKLVVHLSYYLRSDVLREDINQLVSLFRLRAIREI